jgi:hypothetical protein
MRLRALRLRRMPSDWEEVPYQSRGGREARGIGLQDLVDAVDRGSALSGFVSARRIFVPALVFVAAVCASTSMIAPQTSE